MKKLLTVAIAMTTLMSVVHYVSAKDFFVNKDGKRVVVDKITADARGKLTFKKGKFKQVVKRSQYRYAYADKPAGRSKAVKLEKAGKYQDAAKAYKELFDNYKYLGWAAYAMFNRADCLAKAGDEATAITELQKWLRDFKSNPKEEKYYNFCNKLLVKLLIKKGDYAAAMPILKKMENSKDDDNAAFATNSKGLILSKQGKKKDATLQYLQTVLLFDAKNKERPEALYMVSTLLKEQNDARSKKFADKLKQDYPNSEFVKQLK